MRGGGCVPSLRLTNRMRLQNAPMQQSSLIHETKEPSANRDSACGATVDGGVARRLDDDGHRTCKRARAATTSNSGSTTTTTSNGSSSSSSSSSSPSGAAALSPLRPRDVGAAADFSLYQRLEMMGVVGDVEQRLGTSARVEVDMGSLAAVLRPLLGQAELAPSQQTPIRRLLEALQQAASSPTAPLLVVNGRQSRMAPLERLPTVALLEVLACLDNADVLTHVVSVSRRLRACVCGPGGVRVLRLAYPTFQSDTRRAAVLLPAAAWAGLRVLEITTMVHDKAHWVRRLCAALGALGPLLTRLHLDEFAYQDGDMVQLSIPPSAWAALDTCRVVTGTYIVDRLPSATARAGTVSSNERPTSPSESSNGSSSGRPLGLAPSSGRPLGLAPSSGRPLGLAPSPTSDMALQSLAPRSPMPTLRRLAIGYIENHGARIAAVRPEHQVGMALRLEHRIVGFIDAAVPGTLRVLAVQLHTFTDLAEHAVAQVGPGLELLKLQVDDGSTSDRKVWNLPALPRAHTLHVEGFATFRLAAAAYPCLTALAAVDYACVEPPAAWTDVRLPALRRLTLGPETETALEGLRSNCGALESLHVMLSLSPADAYATSRRAFADAIAASASTLTDLLVDARGCESQSIFDLAVSLPKLGRLAVANVRMPQRKWWYGRTRPSLQSVQLYGHFNVREGARPANLPARVKWVVESDEYKWYKCDLGF